jgi:hypothetical protein
MFSIHIKIILILFFLRSYDEFMAVMKGRLSRGFHVSFFFSGRTIQFVYGQYIGRRNTDRTIIKTGPYTVKV